MKTKTVYKVVTKKDLKSCICGFHQVSESVQQAYGVQYSTVHWTLPNHEVGESGLFVFDTLKNAEKFCAEIDCCRADKRFVIYEAIAFGVRPKRSVACTWTASIESFQSFWRTLKGFMVPNYTGMCVADGVKLVQLAKRTN
jgi:hypothetical protein